jgi:site-specific recombinase XerD
MQTTVALKPKTREDYRSLLHNHILPAFGDRAIASIDTLAVRGWLAELVSEGLSPSRAKHAYYVLFAVLEAAIQAGALVRNPAAAVRVPRSHSREMHFLSAAEVEQLAEAIAPPYGRAGPLRRLHRATSGGDCSVAGQATRLAPRHDSGG